jgi:hypothetical protein
MTAKVKLPAVPLSEEATAVARERASGKARKGLTVELLKLKIERGKVLTDLHVRTVQPSAKPEEIRAGLPGMVLLVAPSGRKSFAVRFRVDGRLRKLTLGKFPRVSLGDARKAAKIALGRVAKGEDPTAERREARAAAKARATSGDLSADTLFADGRDAFLANYAKRRTRASTAYQTQRLLTREFKPLDKRKVGDVTSKDVRRIVERSRSAGAA